MQFVLFLTLSIIIEISSCLNNCSSIKLRNKDNQNNLIQEDEDDILNNNQELTIDEQQQKNNNNYISINSISKNYNNLNVVNNFRLELFPDEIFCLLGVDSSGKTTLLNMIAGLIPPSNGDILFLGNSLIRNKNLINRNITLCFQENILFDFLTVNEHFQYISKMNGYILEDPEDIPNLLNYLDLSGMKNRFCKDLLEQEKRKLCFGLAMISNKKILILDEPTKELELITKKEIWNFIKCNKKDQIILVSTNSPQEAEYLGTRIGLIKNGNLVCSGQIDYLKQKYNGNIKNNINLYINSETFNEHSKKVIFEKIQEIEPLADIKIISNEIISIYIINNGNIAKITNFLNEAKNLNFIVDYKIDFSDNKNNNNSLEQIFNQINNISIFNQVNELNNNNIFNFDFNIRI